MDSSQTCFALLLLITSASVHLYASSVDDEFHRCESVVHMWATSEFNEEVKEDKHTLRDLLFFLHIPRTGGRTYFHCFLKKLYSTQLECPRSYDKLRFNPRKANCRLLSTHDDYSMMTKLPKEKTSLVTILRNPIDRVFSTYEFSIEVAARFLVHPNLTSAMKMTMRLRKKSKAVSTLDIWPWKYLVPWMREDVFARRKTRLQNDKHYVARNDSYNMEDTTMPLHQYINDPIAMDIVHNGATFQVAGLTNNSYLSEAHEVRACVQKYPDLGESVLEVAKRRLDHMLYVGLTEDHKGSATTFAQFVGAQVISQLVESNSGLEHLANTSEKSQSIKESESQNGLDKSSPKEDNVSGAVPSEVVKGPTKSKMTVDELMDAYETCIGSLRKTQSKRRTNSLMRISPVNFTKEARLNVPESTLQQISSLNRLDMELYKYAQEIFARQKNRKIHKLEKQDGSSINSHETPPWRDFSFGLAVVLFALLLFLFVKAKRRISKVKI